MLPEMLYFRAGKFVEGGHRSAKSRGAFWIAFWVGYGVGVLLGVNTAQKPRRSGDSEGRIQCVQAGWIDLLATQNPEVGSSNYVAVWTEKSRFPSAALRAGSRARKKALGMTSISPHAAIMANVSSTRADHDKRFATRGKAGHLIRQRCYQM